MKTYSELEAWLDHREVLGIQLGLDRVSMAAAALGNPQDQVKVVLVAGTNGKGSTTTAIAGLLHLKGFRVGAYLSPHLVTYTERFQLNGATILSSELLRLISPMIETGLVDRFSLTVFEVLTLAAYTYFAENHVDFAIVEVGLGGRFDATNIVTPVCSVITPIGYDHMDLLGDTLYQIASEKAGIIKKKKKVFCAKQLPDALKAIREKADSEYADLDIVEKDNSLPLPVDYQKQNVALALAVVNDLLVSVQQALSRNEVDLFLRSFSFGGRFEWVRDYPPLVLDGAHNEMGIEALLAALPSTFPGAEFCLAIGILARKSAARMLEKVFFWSKHQPVNLRKIAFFTIPGQKSCTAQELLSIWHGLSDQHSQALMLNTDEDFIHFLSNTEGNQATVCLGSLYLVGYIKKYLLPSL